MKWYQSALAYLLMAIVEFQAFDLVREGMSMISFFLITMLVLVGMMSLSAPAKFRTAARRLLTIAAVGPPVLFLLHISQMVTQGLGLSWTDMPGIILLLLPSALLLTLCQIVLRPQEIV